MDTKKDHTTPENITRRNFLKKSSLVTLAGFSGVVEAIAAAPRPQREYPRTGRETANCAIIGFGPWGREIAENLGKIPEANVAAVCDHYSVLLRRAQRDVPGVTTHADYREVLDNPEIQVVFVATPTHAHRELVVAALDAGKHVYCEAPMASSMEDARAIAVAARDKADTLVFQAGQQYRFDPQYQSVSGFIRTGALGQPTMIRAQAHAKNSWRRASSTREREMELNWRLDPALSTGLIGEVGLHQLDTAMWILDSRPVSVSGFGQVMLWDDGREVADTIQAVIEFPDGVHYLYDATLASSFDAQYEMYYGSDSTIMLRDSKAWMFKEVDAPILGWEVYARKDKFYKEQGIALVANATQLDAQGVDPTADDPNALPPLWYALKDFLDNVLYGPFESSAGYQQGYDAAVVAIKANEAISQNTKITFEDAWFDLG